MKQAIITIILFTSSICASELTQMENACEHFVSEACYELGKIYSGDDGFIANLKKSKIFYKKACDLDHAKSCLLLEKMNTKEN